MNYYNTLTELESINTTHLSDKGLAQVAEFEAFVTPLIPDIRKGDAAKAKIAEFYLRHKSQYTDGCVKVLEPLINQLGVSAGYISQLKKAKEYKDNILHPQLKQWVDEHPVTIQYRLSKAPHKSVMEKFLTGKHCSKREAENFTRVKNEKQLTQPAEPTPTDYQIKVQRAQEMAEDTSYKYLINSEFAQTFMAGTTNSTIAACMEKVSRLTTCDKKEKRCFYI